MSNVDKTQKENKARVETYKKTDVFTANRETILLMMYAGALRFLKQAIEASKQGNLADKVRLIGKTQEIVNELRSTLNYEIGGDIATTLEKLYSYITQRLIQGNLEKKTELLEEAYTILSTLNEAWEQAIALLRKEKARTEK